MTAVETLAREIEPLAQRYGLAIYDLDVIAHGRPTLRVYAERRLEESGGGALDERAESGATAQRTPNATIGELESFARVLIPYLSMKDLFPREGQIEVSSPGMNRRLRRPAHFVSAVGQTVAVTAQTPSGKQTVKAKLTAVSDEGIALDSAQIPHVGFADIIRAQMEPEIKF